MVHHTTCPVCGKQFAFPKKKSTVRQVTHTCPRIGKLRAELRLEAVDGKAALTITWRSVLTKREARVAARVAQRYAARPTW